MPLHVDQASLAKGTADMRDSIEQVRSQLSKIRGEVAASSAFWSGSAAASFGTLMTEYDTKANKLQGVLDTIALLVDKSSANHVNNEEMQGRNMNSLMGMLTGSA
ncbi:WXG100 family type VII secretion target [Stackebrandtia albiflava]|uniref:WXG100 family type VII secretion target n=1 Tax=Stackebrandtia albiflava TaxID=406432 RepID=A0A562V3N3_9ACTN|nr:WXG100 family type VII secretion target [Stackebrandtia albiflava]